MNPYISKVTEIFRGNNLIIGALSLPLFIIGALTRSDIISVVSAVFVFTLFDALGWGRIISVIEADLLKITTYRLMQITFQILLCLVLVLVSVVGLLQFLVLWWFGLCDLLYYFLLRQGFITGTDDIFWLKWTPFGILGIKINFTLFVIQACIGIGISTAIYFICK